MARNILNIPNNTGILCACKSAQCATTSVKKVHKPGADSVCGCSPQFRLHTFDPALIKGSLADLSVPLSDEQEGGDCTHEQSPRPTLTLKCTVMLQGKTVLEAWRSNRTPIGQCLEAGEANRKCW